MSDSKTPRRKRFQFGLRSFIVLTTLIAIGASGYDKWSASFSLMKLMSAR